MRLGSPDKRFTEKEAVRKTTNPPVRIAAVTPYSWCASTRLRRTRYRLYGRAPNARVRTTGTICSKPGPRYRRIKCGIQISIASMIAKLIARVTSRINRTCCFSSL